MSGLVGVSLGTLQRNASHERLYPSLATLAKCHKHPTSRFVDISGEDGKPGDSFAKYVKRMDYLDVSPGRFNCAIKPRAGVAHTPATAPLGVGDVVHFKLEDRTVKVGKILKIHSSGDSFTIASGNK